MPNGYTSAIYDGTNTDPAAYLRRVARGFGAFSTFRDDAVTDELPELPNTLPADAYQRRSVVSAREELDRLRALTEDEALEEFNRRKAEADAFTARSNAERAAIHARYHDVLNWVRRYFVSPSPEHGEFRSQAIRWLEESIKSDAEPISYNPFPYTSPEAWRSRALDNALLALKRAEEELTKAIERAESRYRWATLLEAAITEMEAL